MHNVDSGTVQDQITDTNICRSRSKRFPHQASVLIIKTAVSRKYHFIIMTNHHEYLTLDRKSSIVRASPFTISRKISTVQTSKRKFGPNDAYYNKTNMDAGH